MKKNKTVAFMLAATLMVGGTFLGTKAWFSDKAEASNDLVLTMGTLDVVAEVNGEGTTDDTSWTIVNANTEITGKQNADNGNNFKNVSPRDSFEKTITVTNKGTLKQQITMSDLDLVDGKVLPTGVTVDLKVKTGEGDSATYVDFGNSDKSYQLAPEASKEFKVVVKFDGASINGEYSATQTPFDGTESNKDQTLNLKTDDQQKFNFNQYFKAITIQADQLSR